MKWEPVLAMIVLVGLGMWLVWGPLSRLGLPDRRPGSRLVDLRLHSFRGALEIVDSVGDQPATFRFLFRGGQASEVLSSDELDDVLPHDLVAQLSTAEPNALFRVMNITRRSGLIWVLIGFGAQAIFSARFLFQWLVSERKGESVVPVGFWWMSLVGGIGLFTYFTWRQDIVGVLGQSTGLVIYARNLRLIHKRRDDPAPAGEVAQ